MERVGTEACSSQDLQDEQDWDESREADRIRRIEHDWDESREADKIHKMNRIGAE